MAFNLEQDLLGPGHWSIVTLTFGATAGSRSLAFCNPNGEDVNGDGRLDLVCQGRASTGFKRGDKQAVLKGQAPLRAASSREAPRS